MNLKEKIKQLYGSQSNQNSRQITEWRQEADANLRGLLGQSDGLEKTLQDIKDYRAYDKEKAYYAVTGESLHNVKQRMLIKWVSSVAAVILILVCSVYFIKTNLNRQDFISTEIVASVPFEKVELVDKTAVTLAQGSKITTYSPRAIGLKGRAFFDVTSTENKEKFTVSLQKGKITVLGTRFSVTSDPFKTEISVEEGKVRYEYNGKSEIVSGGEWLALEGDKLILHKSISNNQFSWSRQVLNFKNTPINEALIDINRHFGINIVIDQNIKLKPSCLITSKFTNESIDELFKELQLLFNITYSRQGGTYIITQIQC